MNNLNVLAETIKHRIVLTQKGHAVAACPFCIAMERPGYFSARAAVLCSSGFGKAQA